jgi:hypothetical protein
MSSDRRIQSSRANGAKSRGPITPEGRARSSQNAIRHGFNATSLVLGNESADEFEELFVSYIEYWQPANPVEMDLVEEMVAAKWRQRLMWAVETSSYELKMERQEAQVAKEFVRIHAAGRQCIAIDTLINESKTVTTYIRYESRMNRIYDRAFTRLQELKKSQNEPNPDSEQNAENPDAPATHPSEPPELGPTKDTLPASDPVPPTLPSDNDVCPAARLSEHAKSVDPNIPKAANPVTVRRHPHNARFAQRYRPSLLRKLTPARSKKRARSTIGRDNQLNTVTQDGRSPKYGRSLKQ